MRSSETVREGDIRSCLGCTLARVWGAHWGGVGSLQASGLGVMEALWGDVNMHHVCQNGSAFCSGLGYSHTNFYHFLLCLICEYLMQLLVLNSEFALCTGGPTTTTWFRTFCDFSFPPKTGSCH